MPPDCIDDIRTHSQQRQRPLVHEDRTTLIKILIITTVRGRDFGSPGPVPRWTRSTHASVGETTLSGACAHIDEFVTSRKCRRFHSLHVEARAR